MSTKINVLQVIPKLSFGGAETGCYDIAHYLAEKECGSFIATAGGELLKFIDKKKVTNEGFILKYYTGEPFKSPFVILKLQTELYQKITTMKPNRSNNARSSNHKSNRIQSSQV